MIDWQPITAFGDDLLDFVVYRSPAGQAVNLQTNYASTLANSTIDVAVQPGQSWSYWVQSIHQFGVTSNLSSPLTVDIPYPTPKSFVPNLTAADVPDDDGGVMAISEPWRRVHRRTSPVRAPQRVYRCRRHDNNPHGERFNHLCRS